MLTSVVSLCVRNRRTVSAPTIRSALSWSVRKSSHRTANLVQTAVLSPHRTSRLLTADPWRFPSGLTAKSLSLSTPALGGNTPDPLGSSDLPDRENFGSLSGDMSSRKWFRKTSPDVHELQYQQEEEQEDQVKPHRRPGRRNTAYWYFLQCKQLIKENKVCAFIRLITPGSFFSLSDCCFCCLTAAGGFGHVQQRHAAGGEAATGGV